MNGRSMAALAALMTLLGATAGCLDGEFLQNAAQDDGQATALENLGPAENAARAWDPAAALVGIFSLELKEGQDDIPADPAVGDGRALLWYYAFANEAGETRAFRVTSDGTVHAERGSMGAEQLGHDVEPLGDLLIDSDAAMEIALENATFAAAVDGDSQAIAEGVARMDGYDGWYLAAVGEKAAAIAIVDAATGELREVREFNMDFAFPMFAKTPFAYQPATSVHEEGEGTLDAKTPKLEVPFTYSGLGDEGRFTLETHSRNPTEYARWKIIDAEDEVIAHGSMGSFMWSDQGEHEWEFDIDAPGEYTLILSYSAPLPSSPLSSGVKYAFVLSIGEDHEHEDDEEKE